MPRKDPGTFEHIVRMELERFVQTCMNHKACPWREDLALSVVVAAMRDKLHKLVADLRSLPLTEGDSDG